MSSAAAWHGPLLAVLEGLQSGALRAMHAVGLAPDIHGQPAWPFPERIAADTLRIDLGLARQVGGSLSAVAMAVLLVIVALAWRRRRPWLLAAAALVATVAPWPSPALVFTRADPTSFHVAPVVSARDIVVRGRALYDQHCATCHGADGRGETPLAATLPTWPPDLTRGLLWQRSDGDLFWRIRHGLRDEGGAPTMPPLAGPLSDADEWALVAFTQALAAGTSLAKAGAWATPVRMPSIDVACSGGGRRRLGDRIPARAGMRARIVALGAGDPAPLPDARFETIAVMKGDGDEVAPRRIATSRGGVVGTIAHTAVRSRSETRFAKSGATDASADTAETAAIAMTSATTSTVPNADCTTDSHDAWQLLALLAGTAPGDLAGTRFIADREGWLRAVSRPGAASWSESDLVCRVGDAPLAVQGAAPVDGLTRLIDAMDRAPVDPTRGGFIH